MQLDSTTVAGGAGGAGAAIIFNPFVDVIVTATIGAIVGIIVTELYKFIKKKLTK